MGSTVIRRAAPNVAWLSLVAGKRSMDAASISQIWTKSGKYKIVLRLEA
jgi:hypothetical protein